MHDRLVHDFGGDIVVVSHGGAIRAAVAHALGVHPENALAMSVDTLSLTRLDHIEGPGKGHNWRLGDGRMVEIVTEGGVTANAAMPAFGQQLADEDVLAVLDFLKSNWGKDEREFQWWVTATSELQKAN